MKRLFLCLALISGLFAGCSDGESGEPSPGYTVPTYTVPAYTLGETCDEQFPSFCDANTFVSCHEGKIAGHDCKDYSMIDNTCVWAITPEGESLASCDLKNDDECDLGEKGKTCQYSSTTINGVTTKEVYILNTICLQASNGGKSMVTISEEKCDETNETLCKSTCVY